MRLPPGILRAKGLTDQQIATLLQPIRVDLHQLNNPQTNYNIYLTTTMVPGLMMALAVYRIENEVKSF